MCGKALPFRRCSTKVSGGYAARLPRQSFAEELYRTDGKQSLSAQERAKPAFSQDSGPQRHLPPPSDNLLGRILHSVSPVNPNQSRESRAGLSHIGSFQPNHTGTFTRRLFAAPTTPARIQCRQRTIPPKILIRTARNKDRPKGIRESRFNLALAKRRRPTSRKFAGSRRPQV